MDSKDHLSREKILRGDIQRIYESRAQKHPIMSDAERSKLIDAVLDSAPDLDNFRLFAYGSLIWNPAIEYQQRMTCSVSGYQRSFCFWTILGRGTPEHPGIMVGLTRGGSCKGVAYQLARESLRTELDILFKRELSTYIYDCQWVKAHDVTTRDSFDAITFVVDTEHDRYIESLNEDKLIQTIATAEGPFGRNCDYLYQLTQAIEELGFRDEELSLLEQKVRAYRASFIESS